MSSKEEMIRERIRILASNGDIFGRGKFVEVRDSNVNRAAQYASLVYFFDVVLQDKSVQNVISVVAKTQLNDYAMELMQSDVQFANEVTMYRDILPALGADDLDVTPKFFYAQVNTNGDHSDDVVILENLKPAGFRVAKGLFLDHEHVTMAMKKLGSVHGLSYRMKRANVEKVMTLAKNLKLIHRNNSDPDRPTVTKTYFCRGFEETISHDVSGIAKKALEKLSATDKERRWDAFLAPEEPFAVFALGDFNSNNIMYKYDETERPIDAKFFDFGTSIYGDPSIDIAFFLYMNTNEENRQKYWDDWFKSYWDGLTDIEPQPGFTRDKFLANFSKRAIYGFLPTSSYLPAMMSEGAPTTIEDWLKQMVAVPLEEKVNLAKTIGGDEATTATSNIVRHLYDKGFLKDFVEKFDTSRAESAS
ncbi:Juvenile hormone-inducible protein [Nesidiocoris tenuis]|uniref:Juvenile hormone-inducible protein n=1 Tax=Nesidiocoris tenuis TaxID=355587 RepID=A0ABN7AS39_9HEMI|nr:Juvenile hormone-inducible protein [Nesidiocoris tenuis]